MTIILNSISVFTFQKFQFKQEKEDGILYYRPFELLIIIDDVAAFMERFKSDCRGLQIHETDTFYSCSVPGSGKWRFEVNIHKDGRSACVDHGESAEEINFVKWLRYVVPAEIPLMLSDTNREFENTLEIPITIKLSEIKEYIGDY